MGMSKSLPAMPESGVYVFMHTPTQSGYVGSSFTSIYNRWSWHKSRLKLGTHTCKAFQKLWNETDPEDWEFVVLEEDTENDVRAREDFWMSYPKVLLNTVKSSTGACSKHSEETKQKMREGRAKYLQTSGAREALSERAKRQHKEGKLGRQTWKEN